MPGFESDGGMDAAAMDNGLSIAFDPSPSSALESSSGSFSVFDDDFGDVAVSRGGGGGGRGGGAKKSMKDVMIERLKQAEAAQQQTKGKGDASKEGSSKSSEGGGKDKSKSSSDGVDGGREGAEGLCLVCEPLYRFEVTEVQKTFPFAVAATREFRDVSPKRG